MLLRPEGKLRRPHCFLDELSNLKRTSPMHPSFKKSCETFNLTLNILDLLIDKSPHLVQQLLTIKKALTKWYDHVRQENLSKTREIFNLKEKLIVGVKKEIGIVLEEIAYYLRSITEEFNDNNLEQYYLKYLNALKKLEWDHDNHSNSQPNNKQIQTDPEWSSAPVIPTQRSIQRGSMSTIESPLKRYKEVDINKYIETKQHNLQLERQLDKLGSILTQAQEQNKKFRMQVAHLLKQNGELCEDSKRYLRDIEKLNQMLQKLKEEQDEKSRREQQIKATTAQTEKKYRKLDSLQEDLHRELENAEEEIYKKEAELRKEEDIASYFNQNYRVEKESFFKTQREMSEQKEGEKTQLFQEYRMLFVQALAIEDFVGQTNLSQPYE